MKYQCNVCGVDQKGNYTRIGSECKGCLANSIPTHCNDPSYNDKCNYKAGEMCNNECQHSLDDCSCEEDTFNIRKSQAFCCNGKKQNLNEPCQGLNAPSTCYNSYQDSQVIGHNAHFSCPGVCVPLLDMCQGMSWCEEDVDVCNKDLRIPTSIQFDSQKSFYGQQIEIKNLTIGHHFYIENLIQNLSKINNGQYDLLDRSDEYQTESQTERFDYTQLEFCQYREEPDSTQDISVGVKCKENDGTYSHCIPINEWCNESPTKCGKINTGNDIVCSNHTFWKSPLFNSSVRPIPDLSYGIPKYKIVFTSEMIRENQRCEIARSTNPNIIKFYGKFCPGRPGQCYYPWYMRADANIQTYSWLTKKILSRTCSEKSAQVFTLGQACPNRTQYHQMYLSIFCQSFKLPSGIWTPVSVYGDQWCGDEIPDFPTNTTLDWIDDPHNCWSSCAVPGENCEACSNTEFFQCPRSRVCIHPDLKCDGHPHCEFEEDEEFTMCREIYFEKKLVKPYANLICQNVMYPNLTTIATACDGLIECHGGKDEKYCSTIGSSSIVLLILTGLVSIYLLLKISRLLINSVFRQDHEEEQIHVGKPDSEAVIAKYERDHDDPETIELMNSHLLHVIHTEEKDEAQNVCRTVYDVEAKQYNGSNSNIFHHFRINFDPLVVSEVLEAKFPGLTQKTIDSIEGYFNKRFITEFQDRVTRTEWMTLVFQTLAKIIKIQANFVDLLKDSLLTYSMLRTVGGYETIINFPTNFSSVIIMISIALIIVPIMMSTLHLILSNPFIIYKSGKENGVVKRILMTIVCVLCSVINPVLLINTLEKTKDEARKEAKKNQSPKQILEKFNKYREIKEDYVHHLSIELGINKTLYEQYR